MSRRDKLIKVIKLRIMNTATRVDLTHQRLPTPQEFAEDVVDFLYGLSDEETTKETKDKAS